MAGFMQSVKNLWNMPEEFDNDGYENDSNSRKNNHKDKKSYDEKSDRKSRRYSDSSYEEDYNYSKEHKYSDHSYSQLNNDDYLTDNIYDNSTTNKVLNINATTRLQVVLFKPTSFGMDVTAIAEELKKSHTVLLNFEETPRDESKRIVDFICGCAFFSDGKVQRVAKNIFLVTPNDVEFIGNSLLDELQSNGLQIDY